MDLRVTDKLELADCEYIMSVVKHRDELAELSPEDVVEMLNDSEVYSIFIDNSIVAFAGVIKPWLSRGVVYFLPDPNMSMRKFVMVKNTLKRIINMFFEDESLNRLEAQVRRDESAFQNWAEKVGFTKESLMKNWGIEGEDYFMYRILK